MRTRIFLALLLPLCSAAPLNEASNGDQIDIAIHGHTGHPDIAVHEHTGYPDVTEVELLFKMIDIDQDGIMDVKELIRVCLENNIDIPETEAELTVTLPDKSEGLTMDKFAVLLADCPSSKTMDMLNFLIHAAGTGKREGRIGFGFGQFNKWKGKVLEAFKVPHINPINEELLKTPDIIEELLKTPDKIEELLKTPDIIEELLKTPDIIEEVLKTPEEVLNKLDVGEEDFKAVLKNKKNEMQETIIDLVEFKLKLVCDEDAVNLGACFCKNDMGPAAVCAAGQGCTAHGTCLDVCTADAVNPDVCFCKNSDGGATCNGGQRCTAAGTCLDVCTADAVNQDVCFCEVVEGEGGNVCAVAQGCCACGTCLDVCIAEAVNQDSCFCANVEGGGERGGEPCWQNPAGQGCNNDGTCYDVRCAGEPSGLTVLTADAITNNGIGGVLIKLIQDGDIIEQVTTDSSGIGLLAIPLGLVVLEVEREGFEMAPLTFTVGEEECEKMIRLTLSDTLAPARVVLSWLDQPNDLDFHTKQIIGGSVTCHCYYGRTDCNGFTLDTDNTSGGINGAETISWSRVDSGSRYLVFVKDYTGGSTHLSGSKARVVLYREWGEPIAVDVPENGSSNRFWKVACFSEDGFELINELVSSEPNTC